MSPAIHSGAAERLAQMRNWPVEKAFGAAFAHVARVDVLEEVVGDEVVADEPDEVGQENEQAPGRRRPRTSRSSRNGAQA